MDRRTFLSWFNGGLSGSFLLGTSGGLGLGAAAGAAGFGSSRLGKTSYSQQGEDLIIESICETLGIEAPSYLDIGAADPIRTNNTYLFYREGCRGVLVEPNPTLCRALRSRRPGDVVLNVGIGVSDQDRADYYKIGGPDGWVLNTFSREQTESLASLSGGRRFVEEVIPMPLVNINRVIEEHFQDRVDLLSIDTEGLDLDILGSLDFERHRPSILCVETLVIGTKRVESEIVDLVTSKGYTVRGSTFVNTIFVDDRLLSA